MHVTPCSHLILALISWFWRIMKLNFESEVPWRVMADVHCRKSMRRFGDHMHSKVFVTTKWCWCQYFCTKMSANELCEWEIFWKDNLLNQSRLFSVKLMISQIQILLSVVKNYFLDICVLWLSNLGNPYRFYFGNYIIAIARYLSDWIW